MNQTEIKQSYNNNYRSGKTAYDIWNSTTRYVLKLPSKIHDEMVNSMHYKITRRPACRYSKSSKVRYMYIIRIYVSIIICVCIYIYIYVYMLNPWQLEAQASMSKGQAEQAERSLPGMRCCGRTRACHVYSAGLLEGLQLTPRPAD